MREFSDVTTFLRGEYVHPHLRAQVFWCDQCGDCVEHVTWARWYSDRVWRGHTVNRQVVCEVVTVECHGTRTRIEDPLDVYRIAQQVMYGEGPWSRS